MTKNIVKNKVLINRETIVLICFTILIFLIHIRNLRELGIFYVLDDEFGYWGNAAYFAGLDWSSAVSQIAYYSYGYSILLIPLFWIFQDPMNMYKGAIIINIIMLCISFLICYDIAKKMSKNVNKYFLMMISFMISMYPAYIAQANIAWSECALIFFCWILTRCFVSIKDKSKWYDFSLIGFLSIYVYIIHQRAIGVFIASILVIIIMKLTRKIGWRQLGFFLFPIIIIAIIHKYIKDDIQINLWLIGSGPLLNDFSTQTVKIISLFTIDGFTNTLKVFAGQFFYLGAASCLLVYFALYEMLEKCMISKHIIKNKHLNIANKDNNFFGYVFLLIAFLITVAISVIFMSNPNRIDHILYGRYTEMIIGPIILLGLILLLNKEKKIPKKDFWFIIVSFCLLTVIVNYILKEYGLDNYNSVCAVGLIIKPNILNGYNVYISAFLSIFLCIVLYFSFSFKKIWISFLTLILLSSFYFYIGNRFTINMIYGENGIQNNMSNALITKYIENYDDDYPIYFLMGKGFNQNRTKDFLQFLLKDKKVICVTKQELDNIDEDKFLIIGGFTNNLFELYNNYTFCLSSADSYLMKSKSESSIYEFEKNLLYDLIELPLNNFKRNKIIDADFMQSNGIKGFLMFGPYIEIDAGKYKFSIEMDLIDYAHADLGYIDIYSGTENKVYSIQEININSFDKNKKSFIEVPFELESDTPSLEFRTYVNEGSQIKINKVYLQSFGRALSMDIFSTDTSKVFESDSFFIQGNGIEGLLMYGPYMNLNRGKHRFTLDLEIINYKKETLGYVEIFSNTAGKVYNKKEINIKDLNITNKIDFTIPFDLDTETTNIELRLFVTDGTEIRINNIYLKQ